MKKKVKFKVKKKKLPYLELLGDEIVEEEHLKKPKESFFKFIKNKIKKKGFWKEASVKEEVSENVKTTKVKKTRKVKSKKLETLKEKKFIEDSKIELSDNILKSEALLNMLEDLEIEKEKARQAQEKSETYLNLAGTIIVALDKNGDILLLNKKGHEVLGYQEGTLEGKNWFDVCLPKRDMINVKKVHKMNILGKDSFVEHHENAILTKKGKERIINWHNTLIKNKAGKIIGTLSSGEDITGRKLIERKVKKSEGKYRTLTLNIPGMVYQGKKDWSTEIISNSEGICGYPSEDFNSGKINWVSLIHPQDKKRIFAEVLILNKKETKLIQEYRIIDKEKKVRWVQDNKQSVFEKGFFVGVIGVAIDITERKKTEEKLKETNNILTSTLSLISGGVDIVDEKSNILWMDDQFIKVFGKESIGKKCYQVYKDNKTQCEQCPLKKPIKLGEVKTLITSGVAGGRTFEIKHQGIMFKGKKAILEVFKDITEKKLKNNLNNK